MSPDVLEQMKADPETNTWTCPTCIDELAKSPPKKLDFSEFVDECSAKMISEEKETLRVVQWNAEALSTKMFELTARMLEEDIDICLIQESHLQEKNQTPYIEGYKTMRADRTVCKHGGLIAFVKKTLISEDLGSVAIDATETLTLRVRMGKDEWIHITNVYIPPPHSIGQDVIELRTDIIPALKSSLICSDFNGHSPIWDSVQPADSRGSALVDWSIDNKLTIMNDGSATHVKRDTGGLRMADITL